MAIRAVLDTSSLVPSRQRRDLQESAQLGLYTAIWSPWTIAELTRVLTWQWLERDKDFSHANWVRCGDAAKQMMTFLLTTFELVAPVPPYPPAWEQLQDVWDWPLWAAAKEGHAQYVVSENSRDFPPRQADGRYIYDDIAYLSGQDFLDLILGKGE
jgi:hypothetical protein